MNQVTEIIPVDAQEKAKESEEFLDSYKAFEITTAAAYSGAGEDLKAIKARWRELDALRGEPLFLPRRSDSAEFPLADTPCELLFRCKPNQDMPGLRRCPSQRRPEIFRAGAVGRVAQSLLWLVPTAVDSNMYNKNHSETRATVKHEPQPKARIIYEVIPFLFI